MKIHAVASMPHYLRHILPIWLRLPADVQGDIFTRRRPNLGRIPAEDVLLVASWVDAVRTTKHNVIYVEHGAGQSYGGDPQSAGNPSYHGSRHPNHIIGYIAPRQSVADSWGRPAFAAGCPAIADIQRQPEQLAVITWHYDAHNVSPEARSARLHWAEDIDYLIGHLWDCGYTVAGHWHPKDTAGPKRWKRLRIPVIESADEVLRTAALVVADNTSLMYEAAALDIPVAVLNAPWYRTWVHHGLRFWSHVPGPEFWSTTEFTRAYWDNPHFLSAWSDRRYSVSRYAYGPEHLPDEAARWVTELAIGCSVRT